MSREGIFKTPEAAEAVSHLKSEINDNGELEKRLAEEKNPLKASGPDFIVSPNKNEILDLDEKLIDNETGYKFGVHYKIKQGSEYTVIYNGGWHTSGIKKDFPKLNHFLDSLSENLNANIIFIDDLGCGDSQSPKDSDLDELTNTESFDAFCRMKARVASKVINKYGEFQKKIIVGGTSQGALEALTMASLENWPKDIPIAAVLAIDPPSAEEKTSFRLGKDFAWKEKQSYDRLMKKFKKLQFIQEEKKAGPRTFLRKDSIRIWLHYIELLKKGLLHGLLEKNNKPAVVLEGLGFSDDMFEKLKKENLINAVSRKLTGKPDIEMTYSHLSASDKTKKIIHGLKKTGKKILYGAQVGRSHDPEFDEAVAISAASKIKRILKDEK
ncbi:hypothetical protein C4569_01245 [Candidatus Parcubacteria bacterium]|nr:MAG: hypothetical protein C4569_01245 [Candidatus Parcubacteria bacterium]